MPALGFGIKIPIDSKKTVAALTKIEQQQIPFAIASALTRTAAGARVQLIKAMATHFDKPTPYTKKAVGFTPAKKRALHADVYIRQQQWEYLQYEVNGGVRPAKHKAIPVPTRNLTDRNRYGNLRKTQLKRIINHPDTFSGKVKGVAGVWQRLPNGGVKLLVAWEPRAAYTSRYPFAKITKKYVRDNYSRIFRKSLRDALKTANKSAIGTKRYYASERG
jgi:hypothetical protein